MPTVYSSTGTQWPLLQSKTEQKFKSGLFTVSAEFIRPVGNTGLPTGIETSIGDVDVWPEPTVSSGTDGFERINATGYGVWDNSVTEVTYDYSAETLPVYWSLELNTPPYVSIVETSLSVIFETAHIRKIGDSIPQLGNLTLRILSATGADITDTLFDVSQFDARIIPSIYAGTFQKKIRTLIQPVMAKKNTYGEIIETEVTYGFIKHDAAELNQSTALSFGYFSLPPAPNP
jgi:hypothetical protein